MRKTHAHAVCRAGTDSHRATLVLEQACKRFIARTHHRQHRQPSRAQITRGAHTYGNAIKHMQKFAAAEARSRTGGKKYSVRAHFAYSVPDIPPSTLMQQPVT